LARNRARSRGSQPVQMRGKAKFVRQGVLLLISLSGTVALVSVVARGRARAPDALRLCQIPAGGDMEYYRNARSVVDWPLPEVMKALPELKGLKPVPSQEELAPIIKKVGQGVADFFQNFPNVASIEKIDQERVRPDGIVAENVARDFRYVVLARAEGTSAGFEEYRTDSKGRPIEAHDMQGAYLLTRGFASASIHFHPLYQAGSNFRYLGRQVIDKRETFVVAFAQRPETARVVGQVEVGEASATVLLQGVAWIDATAYQIVRMRTDLLAPRPDFYGLAKQTTQVRFREVQFKHARSALWLPHEVVVTTYWNKQILRNRHRYSKFRLFTVETEQRLKEEEVRPPAPQKPG
jgi:hypothetical protein